VIGRPAEIARHRSAQSLFRPPAHEAFAPLLVRFGCRIVQHPVPGGALDRPAEAMPQQLERHQHDGRQHQSGDDVAQGGGRRSQHPKQRPFGVETADVNRKEDDDEDDAPVEIRRRPRPGVRDRFAVNEPDDRIRWHTERAIRVFVLGPGEFIAVAGGTNRQRLPPGRRHADPEQETEAEHTE
jgi:hypothetical protein